ncbi:hypothetical protein [Parapedobacter sp. 10938]|uniref:hypothetical protein n=1 Tax=Parapedobacter flavus TaxID=3110225 RepID=UPI002DB7D84E|nr:hypothetical protein [Parapedobacter sp. 10938]MEC3878616.1 hypothetical protein [Parapedobacter sp. 10938]
MRKDIISVACLALVACSTHRNRTKNTASIATEQQHRIAVHDTTSRQLAQVRFTHSLQGRLAEVEIVPRGTFRYHPDSGYTGGAEKVTVKHWAVSYHVEADSVATSEMTASAVEAEQHSDSHSAYEKTQRELERHPAVVPRYGWVWLVTAVALLALAWLYRRIRAKL